MSTLLAIPADRVAPQAWRNGGGQTRELLAWPDAARWQLRISRADITTSGPFSAFPGVQRWFVVLTGEGVVLHMPTPDGHTLDHVLLPGHNPLHFDGGLAPGCTLLNGPTQDLNLMVRGGQACLLAADFDTMADEQGAEVANANHVAAWPCNYAMGGIYTSCSGQWTDGQQTLALPAHSLLWLQQAAATTMHFTADPANTPDPGHTPAAWWLGFTPETPACSTT